MILRVKNYLFVSIIVEKRVKSLVPSKNNYYYF